VEPAPPGEIVFVCGATATGKSTVGFSVYLAAQRDGHTAGFLDLQQLGFLRPADHRLKAANAAAAWREFHAHGARRLVVVGHIDQPGELRHYAEAIAPTGFTLYRLRAGADALRDRIGQRALGGGPGIAGDELRGRPAEVLDAAHAAAIAQGGTLDRAGIGDFLVDTDDRTVDDLAAEIVQKTGW
jgi:chloramphenicol 3-O-phosphotransferase